MTNCDGFLRQWLKKKYFPSKRLCFSFFSKNEVSNLEGNLENQRAVLQTERGKQERVAATVTDLMYSESKVRLPWKQ